MSDPGADRRRRRCSGGASRRCASCESALAARRARRSTRCRWACRTISRPRSRPGATMVRIGTAIFGAARRPRRRRRSTARSRSRRQSAIIGATGPLTWTSPSSAAATWRAPCGGLVAKGFAARDEDRRGPARRAQAARRLASASRPVERPRRGAVRRCGRAGGEAAADARGGAAPRRTCAASWCCRSRPASASPISRAGSAATRRLVRCMPNTPALIGAGITGLYARPEVDASATARSASAMLERGRRGDLGRATRRCSIRSPRSRAAGRRTCSTSSRRWSSAAREIGLDAAGGAPARARARSAARPSSPRRLERAAGDPARARHLEGRHHRARRSRRWHADERGRRDRARGARRERARATSSATSSERTERAHDPMLARSCSS